MSVRSIFRATVVSGGIAALGLIAVAPAAYAGSTNSQDILTPGWEWSDVENDGQFISDLGAYFPDFQGTGTELYGWSDDAFDGLFESYGWSDAEFTYPGYGAEEMNFSPVSENYVNNGLTTIVGSQDIDFGDGLTFTATSTMEIQGSYVRWAVSLVSTGVGDLDGLSYTFTGNLGSDGQTVWVAGAAGEYVSYQDPASGYWLDPILGWNLTSTGTAALDVATGNDDVIVAGTGDFVLTLVAAEWDVCSFDAALAGVTAALPTLDATFGGTLGEFYTTNCWALASPAVADAGTAIDFTVALDAIPAQFGVIFDEDDSDYLDDIGLIVKSAPAGVTVTLERDVDDNPYLHVVGAMPATTSTIEVVLYSTYDYDEGSWPFISTMTLTPTAVATEEVADTDAAELAATGASEQTPWFGAGAAALLLAGTGLLVWRRRA